jgi:hypothetical protein
MNQEQFCQMSQKWRFDPKWRIKIREYPTLFNILCAFIWSWKDASFVEKIQVGGWNKKISLNQMNRSYDK